MKAMKYLIPGMAFIAGLFFIQPVQGFLDIDVNINKDGGGDTRKIDVSEGQEFTIILPVEAREGYLWQLENSPGDNVQLLNVDRCKPQADVRCTEEQWHFRAFDEGKETLRFRYALPSDPDNPIRRIIYKIDVHD